MAVAVFGLGYVGLPTAAVFASRGVRVIGVDVDEEKVRALNRGLCTSKEPGLCELLREALGGGYFVATSDGVRAVGEAEAVIIAVPTPVRGGVVDLSYLRSALEVVRRGLRRGQLVVVESTVPPGTTAGFVRSFLEGSGLRVEEDFYLAHVPERIAPGRAVEELLKVQRVVGGVGPRSAEKAVELYSRVNPNLVKTDATTAEFVKLMENAYRDLNIAFANLMALIAERLGVDVYEAIRLANTHPRVHIHWPGAGVGGPCLTKDPYMLASVGEGVFGVDLLRLARRINDYMPHHVVELVEKALAEEGVPLRGSRIAVYGAAYKGGVDDVRESPAGVIVRELMSRGASVVVYDPYTPETFGAERAGDPYEAASGADVAVFVTDHPEFRRIDLRRLGAVMRRRIIVDGRRIFEPREAVGFKYRGVGFV